MSKPAWGKIGAWAADAERAEAEEQEAAAINEQPVAIYPSLQEANATKKKKKTTKMSLQEFSKHGSRSQGLTHEEMLRLPTGPQERSPDEMQYGRLGGGFSNYGNRYGSVGSNQSRGRDYEDRRSHGFEDDDRRERTVGARVADFNQPSRADEVDNWASAKKQTVPDYNSVQSRSGGRYTSLGGGGGGGGGGAGIGSRADEADNWVSVKKPMPPPQQTRSSSFGSGFSKPEPDRWTRNQQRLVLDPQSSDVEVAPKSNKSNPFGAARPREEVLAEKGLDWKKLDSDMEVKKQPLDHVLGGSRPTSSQSSRPGTPHSSGASAPSMDEGVVRQKAKVNPFGDAKPREVLLEEKGLDWRKIDLKLEHRQVDRPESEEEKNLKEEIEHIKKEMSLQSTADQTVAQELVLRKEQELELLVQQMDDNIRYTQKHFERSGVEAGRGSAFNERPQSRPGRHDEPRAFDESVADYSSRSHSRPTKYDDPRFGVSEEPKAGFSERPPSRSGAWENPPGPGNFERPRSRQGDSEESRASFLQRSSPHGAYQESRSNDYKDRPRSRGNASSWTRSVDDRRGAQGGGGRGYPGRRDEDRSGSRW